jgi:hypothetical protein
MMLSLAFSCLLGQATSFQVSPPVSSTLGRKYSMLRVTSDDEFTVGVIGDLHIDPRKMDDYAVGRSHFLPIFNRNKGKNAALVSLGDLGESKPVWEGSSELFSGTTECHERAAEYLSSFGVPYEVVGGNHGK